MFNPFSNRAKWQAVSATRLLSIAIVIALVWPVSACPLRKRATCGQHGTFTAAPDRPEDKVKKAIDNGILFLRDQEKGKGSFEHSEPIIARVRPGGVTALAVVALLKSGVPADDPLIQRCLKYLRTLRAEQTYTVGLQTMAFCLAKQKEDRTLVQRNLDWLRENRTKSGWAYDGIVKSPDHSNTRFALLGIREAHRAGFKIDREMLEELRVFYSASKKGEWHYRNGLHPSLAMTSAGLANLLATIEMLDTKKTEHEEQLTRMAADRLGELFPPDLQKVTTYIFSVYYSLHSLRIAGELSGQRILGKYDWRQLGIKCLLETQKANGSWSGTEGFDRWPPISTSFALLFLAPEK